MYDIYNFELKSTMLSTPECLTTQSRCELWAYSDICCADEQFT